MTGPPRIAVVRDTYTAFGGGERIVNRIVGALAAEGLDITILARDWATDGSAMGEAPPPNVRWQKINPPYLGGAMRMVSFARAVRAAVARQSFDLVQSHERIAGMSLYRAGDGVHREWLTQRARVRGVAASMLAAASPQHRVQLAAERALFRDPALRMVVCNSEMVSREIARWFDVPPHKRIVIRNGIDLELFAPASDEVRRAARTQLRLPGDDAVFLYVGSGFERKGVAGTLHALAGVAGAHLLVVGKDKHAAAFGALAHKLGLATRVHFTGAVLDVRPYYRAADAFVLPTLYDPQPNAALEAMACALPVITSRKCGAAELLDQSNGAVCDALDIAAITAALRRFADRDAARAAGAAARRAIEPYSLQRMGGEYVALYRRLLATSTNGATAAAEPTVSSAVSATTAPS
jgi:UDP-glucose:(heptosyl)LPS alpha-1,3-glucosyltransferase